MEQWLQPDCWWQTSWLRVQQQQLLLFLCLPFLSTSSVDVQSLCSSCSPLVILLAENYSSHVWITSNCLILQDAGYFHGWVPSIPREVCTSEDEAPEAWGGHSVCSCRQFGPCRPRQGRLIWEADAENAFVSWKHNQVKTPGLYKKTTLPWGCYMFCWTASLLSSRYESLLDKLAKPVRMASHLDSILIDATLPCFLPDFRLTWIITNSFSSLLMGFKTLTGSLFSTRLWYNQNFHIMHVQAETQLGLHS